MTFVEEVRARAGFWRRFGALIVDALIILIPLQILIVILFAQTNGAVQGSFGLTYTQCLPVSQLPPGLDPVPPADSNSATECRTGLFGFDTSRTLTVSKVVQSGSVTSSTSIVYSLNADGQPIAAFHTDWLALLALLAYLIFMEKRSGATVGKEVLDIRTVPTAEPGKIGLSLKQAVVRQAAQWIGTVPALLVVFATLYLVDDPLATMASSGFWMMVAIAGLIEVAWILWIIISVSRKHDPIYDRIAGTSVMRTK